MEKLQHTLESSAVKGVRPVSFGVNPPEEDELGRALLTERLENKVTHVFASSASEASEISSGLLTYFINLPLHCL